MSRHAELAIDDCPIARTSALIAQKWVMLIIRDLADGPCRYSELQTSLRINPRTLSERLSHLEAQGVVEQKAGPDLPGRMAYALTRKGRALLPVLEAMKAFGTTWL
ncbi:MAG: helix-turn-helix domain-containing protein [Anaerolineales bacterium]